MTMRARNANMKERLAKLKEKEKRPRTASAAASINPMDIIADSRRDFYTALLDKIQSLSGPIPDHLQQDIRAYATPTPSERGLLQLIDCTAEEIREVLETLLQPPHLTSLQLATTLRRLIDTIRHRVVIGTTSQQQLNPDEKARFLIKEYARKNLSAHMTDRPADLPPTDVPFDRMKKELDVLFGYSNPLFTLLESKVISENMIKHFLANSDFQNPDGKTNIRYAIHDFIRHHRFDPILELFKNGFVPTKDSDWEKALPQEYYEQFPKIIWKIRDQDEFEWIVNHADQFSLGISDMVRYANYTGMRIPVLGGGGTTRTPAPKREDKPKPQFLTFPNAAKMELLQRNRPWVKGMVSVLIQPVLEQQPIPDYLGEPLQRTGFFFPSDQFFKDLAQLEKNMQHQEGDVFSMTNHQKETKKMRIAHWMKDGQVVLQTPAVFEKGWAWMERERSVVVPNVGDYFLELDLQALSKPDMDFLTRKIRADMASFFSAIFHEKVDLDRIVSEVEEPIRQESVSLRDYLEKVFRVMVLIDPRYKLKSVLGNYFPVIGDRFRLFLYDLSTLHNLPVPFFYPQYPFIDQVDQMRFNTWLRKMGDYFCISHVVSLLHTQYPDLRVSDSHSMPSHLLPPCTSSMPTGFPPGKAAFFLPYKDEFVWLPDVASSLLHQEEFLVHGEPLDSTFLQLVSTHFQLDRAEKGIGAMFIDNGYEVEDNTVPNIENTNVSTRIQSSPEEENLPSFKSKAFEYLQSLR